MKFLQKSRSNRWIVLDQTFYDLFISFSLIELTNVGAGLIDGLIVGRFFLLTIWPLRAFPTRFSALPASSAACSPWVRAPSAPRRSVGAT